MDSKRLSSKCVGDLAPYEPQLEVYEEATIKEMVELMVQYPTKHHLCVVDRNEKLQGWVNRKRLFRVVFYHDVSRSVRVSQLLTLVTSESAGDLLVRHACTTTEDAKIVDVIKTMIEHGLIEIPVVDEGEKVLGLLTSEILFKEWLSN